MRALKKARQPSILEWAFCVTLMLAGLYTLYKNADTKPLQKSDLVTVEGMPESPKLTTITSATRGPREIIDFRLAGHHIEYGSGDTNYAEIKTAISSGQPLKLGLDTRTPLVPIDPRDRICEFQVGNRQLLSFRQSEQASKQSGNAVTIVAVSIILLSLFAFYSNWTQLQNYQKAGGAR